VSRSASVVTYFEKITTLSCIEVLVARRFWTAWNFEELCKWSMELMSLSQICASSGALLQAKHIEMYSSWSGKCLFKHDWQ
jgi:hypothetical protein